MAIRPPPTGALLNGHTLDGDVRSVLALMMQLLHHQEKKYKPLLRTICISSSHTHIYTYIYSEKKERKVKCIIMTRRILIITGEVFQ